MASLASLTLAVPGASVLSARAGDHRAEERGDRS